MVKNWKNVSRRDFSRFAAAAALPVARTTPPSRPKILIAVAHPDDEYAFAAFVYRVARELGGIVDQCVISNGEAGFKYSTLASAVYGVPLTDERVGRGRLPEIRKRETLAAGKILGIRRHYFLGQRDGGLTFDPDAATQQWNTSSVTAFLTKQIQSEQYDFVLTLLPTVDTHGHHQAAARILIDAVAGLPLGVRPAILAGEPGVASELPRHFVEVPGRSGIHVASNVFEFSRKQSFGYRRALDYSIVVNWVIAEHKSQGLFQTDAGKHDVERFWLLASDESREWAATKELFRSLSTASPIASLSDSAHTKE